MTKAMRLFGILAVAALAAASPALANCNPGKNAGQLSDVNAYQSTVWPSAVTDSLAGQMVGRFWQPGIARTTMSEGTYTIDMWFPSADVVGLPGDIMFAFMGDENVLGCPATQLITVLQSPESDGDGASFVVARVDELSGPFMDFDYTRTSTEGVGWVGKPLVKPAVTSNKLGPKLFSLSVAGPSVGNLFYGVSGMLPEGTIVARRLYSFIGPGAPGSQRSPRTSGWSYTTQRLTGVAGGTATLPNLDCNTLAAGQDLFLAWALEFEGGFVSDFVGKNTQVVCNSGLAAPGKFKNIDKRQGPKAK